MRIILKEEHSLGGVGDIVTVKPGYARNFLIPRDIAIVANEGNQKYLEHQKRVLAKKRERLLSGFRTTAGKISRLTIEVEKQVGEEGKIFGSVTTAEVAEHLQKAGLDISKKVVTFPDEIKKVGTYKADVKLHKEVTAQVRIKVKEAAAKED